MSRLSAVGAVCIYLWTALKVLKPQRGGMSQHLVRPGQINTSSYSTRKCSPFCEILALKYKTWYKTYPRTGKTSAKLHYLGPKTPVLLYLYQAETQKPAKTEASFTFFYFFGVFFFALAQIEHFDPHP